MSRALLLSVLLDEGTSMPREVDVDDCTFFGLHTILFVLGGVEVDFKALSFCFHLFSFWVVWEQPLGFLTFSLGSFFAPTSFYFLCFSWRGYPLVEVVSQPSLCLVDSAHT